MAAHIANCGDITVREFISEFRGMTGSEAEGSSATALFEPIENGAGIFGKMEPAWPDESLHPSSQTRQEGAALRTPTPGPT
jgi:hypothetical protein